MRTYVKEVVGERSAKALVREMFEKIVGNDSSINCVVKSYFRSIYGSCRLLAWKGSKFKTAWVEQVKAEVTVYCREVYKDLPASLQVTVKLYDEDLLEPIKAGIEEQGALLEGEYNLDVSVEIVLHHAVTHYRFQGKKPNVEVEAMKKVADEHYEGSYV